MGTQQSKQTEPEKEVQEIQEVEVASPPSRVDIRNKILGAKAESKVIEFFGTQIEVRQPTLGVVMRMRKMDIEDASAQMLMQYTFLPGTNEHIFEDTDAESINQLPFGPDMQRFTDVVNELMGIDTKQLEAMIADARKSPGDGHTPGDNDADSVGAGEGS